MMSKTLRQQIYCLLILVSAGLIFGRIAAVDSIPDRTVQESRMAQIPNRVAERRAELQKRDIPQDRIDADLKALIHRLVADARRARPTLSANDRSRWLTIRALVEPKARVYRYLPLDENDQKKAHYESGEVLRNWKEAAIDQFNPQNGSGRYAKEWVPYAVDKAMETPGWDTIDMVKHGLPDEEYDPANPYSGYLYSSKPTLLPTVMAAPYWVLYHVFGLSLVKQPFFTMRILLVIENLIPLVIAWYFMILLIERFGRSDWGRLFAAAVLLFATFLSTFAVTLNNHLPGFVCVILSLYPALRILADGETKRRYFIAAGFFGAFAVACELPAALITALICLALAARQLKRTLLWGVPAGLAVAAGFFGTNYIAHQTLRPAYAQKRDHIALAKAENPDNPNSFEVKSFDPDDWYIYRYFPGGKPREAKYARSSYWSNRIGIDRGEPSPWNYAFQATVGHHGIISLSPVWLISAAGMIGILFRRRKDQDADERLIRILNAAGLFMTVIFFIFYVSRDQGDRSYGGVTCGLRWFFPLIPFWLLSSLGVIDKMAQSRLGRGTALVLLFFSAMSVSFPVWNPWTHPWFYQLMASLGWI